MFAIRSDDGVLRAFRNVCVHRGARLLEEGVGHCHAIQCPYHHWLYGLDGTLKRTPWFGEDPDFDMAEWPLQADQRRRMAWAVVRRDRPGRAAAREPRRHGRRARRGTHRDLSAVPHRAVGVRCELEDLRRQLHRGLPHPRHPPELLRGHRLREVRSGRDGQRDQDDRPSEGRPLLSGHLAHDVAQLDAVAVRWRHEHVARQSASTSGAPSCCTTTTSPICPIRRRRPETTRSREASRSSARTSASARSPTRTT